LRLTKNCFNGARIEQRRETRLTTKVGYFRAVKVVEPSFQFNALARSPGRAAMAEWLPVLLGLMVLYVPTLYDLVSMIWIRDDQFHGAIVLVVIVWLIWVFGSPARFSAVPGRERHRSRRGRLSQSRIARSGRSRS
jgi:hypothetical protein